MKSEILKEIPTPSDEEMELYSKEWDTQENYVYQERALKKLFQKTYPKNTEMDDVLIKVCALNDFYSTNIFSPYSVAKRIIDLKIDDRLQKGDVTLVNDIAKVTISDKDKNFYSFATKYCSHHKPDTYSIFDKYVAKILMYFKTKDNFYSFKKYELKDYQKYINIITEFKKYYKLDKYNLKELDRYIWLLGKKYFSPKQNNISTSLNNNLSSNKL